MSDKHQIFTVVEKGKDKEIIVWFCLAPNALRECKSKLNKFHCFFRGRFAVVKRCLDAKTKKPYLAKIIKYDDDADRDESLQEFEILRKVKSDKIVMLRDAFLMRKYIVLIMDL